MNQVAGYLGSLVFCEILQASCVVGSYGLRCGRKHVQLGRVLCFQKDRRAARPVSKTVLVSGPGLDLAASPSPATCSLLGGGGVSRALLATWRKFFAPCPDRCSEQNNGSKLRQMLRPQLQQSGHVGVMMARIDARVLDFEPHLRFFTRSSTRKVAVDEGRCRSATVGSKLSALADAT